MNESTLYIASQTLLPQSLHLKTMSKGLSVLSVWWWWQNCKYMKGCDNSSGGEVINYPVSYDKICVQIDQNKKARTPRKIINADITSPLLGHCMLALI